MKRRKTTGGEGDDVRRPFVTLSLRNWPIRVSNAVDLKLGYEQRLEGPIGPQKSFHYMATTIRSIENVDCQEKGDNVGSIIPISCPLHR